MSDRDETIQELRDEFWDLQFEAPRPRAPAKVDADNRRMAEIQEQLGRLSADVGPRPADFPADPG